MKKWIAVLFLGVGSVGLIGLWYAIVAGKIETSWSLVALVWSACHLRALIVTVFKCNHNPN